MTASPHTLAAGRAKTRLVNAHKEEYDRYYQAELNRVGIQTRKQITEERYGKADA
jgi:hypothetical protein